MRKHAVQFVNLFKYKKNFFTEHQLSNNLPYLILKVNEIVVDF